VRSIKLMMTEELAETLEVMAEYLEKDRRPAC
jgi:hypothetical protein